MTGDVIVVQLGDSGTYTGSHFWNIQNEIVASHDGKRAAQVGGYVGGSLFYETAENRFHPRAVWIDAKGSVRRSGSIVDADDGDASGVVEWEGEVDNYSSAAQPEGGLFDYFGDYLVPQIDRKNMYIVDGVWRNPRSSHHRIWSTDCLLQAQDVEEIEECIRRVAEKSDTLAGFMYFLDDTSLWGNIASQILENMQHEYAGKSKMVFATREHGCDGTRLALLEGLATSRISPLVDMYIPMYDVGMQRHQLFSERYRRISHPRYSLFQNAFLKAVGIHGAMAPCHGLDRLDIHSLIHLITGRYNTPFAAIDMVFPATSVEEDVESSSRTLFDRERVSFNQDPILGSDADTGRFTESISILHGMSRDAVNRRIQNDAVRRVQSVSWSNRATWVNKGIPQLPYCIPCADSLGVICRLCGTTSFKNVLESLGSSFQRTAASSMGSNVLASWGVSREEVAEVYNDVQSLAGVYES